MKIKRHLNTKIFSKILALGILINSVSINSFASILSDDGRYETFEGDSIKIDDILEEDKVDVEIEGNTLVNLATKNSGKASELNTIELSYPTDKDIYIQLNCTSNNMESITQFGLIIRVNYSDGTSDCIGFEKDGKSTGILYIQLKNLERKNIDSIRIVPHIDVVSGDAEYEDLMILEGNWINKEVPSYFEGMKSVSQDDENGHKIEILSQNKNLINAKLNTTISANDKYYIKVKPNTKYTLSLTQKCISLPEGDSGWMQHWLQAIDNNNKPINTGRGICTFYFTDINEEKTVKETFTTGNYNKIYIDLGNYRSMSDLQIQTLSCQLEEGNISTTNVNSSLNRKEIILNEPLRGIPGGAKDRIIKRNGQWYIERNCKEILLDGSTDEKWSYVLTDEHNNVRYSIRGLYDKKVNANILTDKLSKKSALNNGDGWDTGSQYNDLIYIYINYDKLGGTDINSWRNYFKNNPLTVVYQLETPIYEPLNIDSTINTYLDTTYISTNSTIPANLKITVDRTMNRATEAVELAKINPTTENLSLARMWTNLLRESIKKDELQSELNNNVDVVDLQLERKTASANVDVYIKCENMLSMNLSTNSITFDDFSGVEDMTKENAVNISINSSLPYNLNAYLATDIQNSDKTNIMNKDILSIKENSELDYQTFSSINDKVVLKSNCDSGNDKQHNVDLKLNGGIAHEKDVYKATIKFEAEQQ